MIVHCLRSFQPALYGLYVLLQALWNLNNNLAQLQARHVKTGVKLEGNIRLLAACNCAYHACNVTNACMHNETSLSTAIYCTES